MNWLLFFKIIAGVFGISLIISAYFAGGNWIIEFVVGVVLIALLFALNVK